MTFGDPERDPAPRLLALATAVPEHILDQAAVAAEAPRLFPGRGAELARLLPVYANAGIGRRYSCLPLERYSEPVDWKTKNDLYIEHAVRLLRQAAEACLAKAGLAAADIDAVVTVSTTGIATPSLDARLMQHLDLREDVERLPIFGLGCAGGVLGLGRAAALARARPGANVLCLVAELCALTFRLGDHSNANIVATALFGDGAAATIITSRDDPPSDAPRLAAWGEHTWRDSLDVMGWSVENDGLGVVFSREIPRLIQQRMPAAAAQFLAKQGLALADIDSYLCHPGGAKVIAALEESFGLQQGSLTLARQVLHDYGNMSAASILFVLEAAMVQGLKGRQLLSALGPGFTAAFLVLEAEGSLPPRALGRPKAAE